MGIEKLGISFDFIFLLSPIKYLGVELQVRNTGRRSQVQVRASTGHHATVNKQHQKVSPSPNHNSRQNFS